MPINACGGGPSPSVDSNVCGPEGEPICRAITADATGTQGANEPFTRLTHEITEKRETGELRTRAAVLSGHDLATGLDLDVLSVAARAGLRRASVEAVAERFGFSTADATTEVHAYLLDVEAELGTRNDDESVGIGLGASASAFGVELSLGEGAPNSLTIGAGVGVGLQASIGIRDIDSDGKSELCAQLGLAVLTLGACVESPF